MIVKVKYCLNLYFFFLNYNLIIYLCSIIIVGYDTYYNYLEIIIKIYDLIHSFEYKMFKKKYCLTLTQFNENIVGSGVFNVRIKKK